MKKATKRAIVILIGILCLSVAVWAAPKLYRVYQTLLREEELRQANIEYPVLDNIVIKRYQGKDYYVKKKPYEGECDWQGICYELSSTLGLEGLRMERHKAPSDSKVPSEGEMRSVNKRPLEEAEIIQVMDYEEYVDYCEEWRLHQDYADPDQNYIVRTFFTEPYRIDASFAGVGYEDSTAVLYFDEATTKWGERGIQVFIIPTDQDVDTVEVVQVYTEEEYNNILEFGQTRNPNFPFDY